MDVPSIIESTRRPVLIVGSVPPAGRDWDLFVRGQDRDAVESGLRSGGFAQVDRHWMRSSEVRPDVVEVLDGGDWQLPAHEIEALFDTAMPFPGSQHLYLPDAPHRLLILARKLPRTPGLLEHKHRELIRATLADAPAAFDEARRQADAWGLSGRLRRLEARYRRAPRPNWPPRRLRRPRRGAVIALSGLDGVGKSTQAEALAEALGALGYDATVVWAPIGQNESLRRFARSVKRGLARVPIGTGTGSQAEAGERHLLSRTEPGAPEFGLARQLSAHMWSTATTLANVLTFRRAARGIRWGGRIVIYDRYVLDTVVELRFRYAPEGRMRLQEALVRALAPPLRRSYLLDLDPAIAHSRKPDWSLEQTRLRSRLYREVSEELGVIRLDAARPLDELRREILGDVLGSLRR